MAPNGHKIFVRDGTEENLPTPRFNEETEAAARPVVPLESAATAGLRAQPARGMWPTRARTGNAWPAGVILALALTALVGSAAVLIYQRGAADVPSTTSRMADEPTVEAVARPAAAPPSIQTVNDVVPVAQAAARQKAEPEQRFPTLRSEHTSRVRQEVERPERAEENPGERVSKAEKKQLKRQRKEAERVAEHVRDAENSDEPKPRLVGVYTERRKQ